MLGVSLRSDLQEKKFPGTSFLVMDLKLKPFFHFVKDFVKQENFFLKNIWHPFNILWGVNKLVLGIVMGSIVFSIGGSFYEYLKKKNADIFTA